MWARQDSNRYLSLTSRRAILPTGLLGNGLSLNSTEVGFWAEPTRSLHQSINSEHFCTSPDDT